MELTTVCLISVLLFLLFLTSTFALSTMEPLHASTSFPLTVVELNKLKACGTLVKWKSAGILVPEPTTPVQLQVVSRMSFSSVDYFADLLSAAVDGGGGGSTTNKNSEAGLIALSATSVCTSAFLVPQLDALSQSVKNTLGLVFLLAPMAFILLSIVAPGLSSSLGRREAEVEAKTNERIAYHEAGHLLGGYLVGAFIAEYRLGGDNDSAIEIEPSSDLGLGGILIVAVSGMVAETLRFGDSKGGAQDLTVAAEALRRAKVPAKSRDGLLRWAVLKALVLLRAHRDELDEVATAMRCSQSVRECILRGVEKLP